MGDTDASCSTDFAPAPCAMRASLSLRLGLASWVGREPLLISDEDEPPLSRSIAGGVGSFSGTLGAGDGLSDLGSEGTGGGVAPSALISMRGFVGVRVREAFDELQVRECRELDYVAEQYVEIHARND